MIKLSSISPAQNRHRFYWLDMEPGLFGLAITRIWGRISGWSRRKTQFYESDEEGEC